MKAKLLPAPVVVLAALLSLTACSDASIPDYLVEGRLPHFGKDQDAPAAAPAPVAKAEPKPAAEHSKPWFAKKPKAERPVAVAPASEPAPVAAPIAAPVAPAPEVAAAAPPPLPPVQTPVQPIAPVPQPQQQVAMAPEPAPVQPAPTPKPRVEHSRSIFGHHASTSETPEPLAGGYQKATNKDAVAAAAAFAVHESPGYVLKGIESARTQVVAGTNYALCLRVRTPGHEANPLHWRTVSAVVFQGLDQHYELASWKEVNICPAG